jgi:hypothetical protein
MPRGYSSIFGQYKAIPAGIAAAVPVVVLMAFSYCNNSQNFLTNEIGLPGGALHLSDIFFCNHRPVVAAVPFRYPLVHCRGHAGYYRKVCSSFGCSLHH